MLVMQVHGYQDNDIIRILDWLKRIAQDVQNPPIVPRKDRNQKTLNVSEWVMDVFAARGLRDALDFLMGMARAV
jgi:hypothetical protein